MRKGDNRGRRPAKKEGRKNGEIITVSHERRQELARLCAKWREADKSGGRIPPAVFERLKAEAGLL